MKRMFSLHRRGQGIAMLAVLALTLSLSAGSVVSPALDKKNMDLTVRPGDDFYRYANGQWIKSLQLPADKSEYDAFAQVREQNRERLHQLFEELAQKAAKAPKDSAVQKVGDFYAAAMDTAKIEALGAAPLQPYLARIDKLASIDEMQDLVADFHKAGIGVIFAGGVEVDMMNSKTCGFYMVQGGIGMPDRDYYTNEDADTKKIREEYVGHVTRMLQLLGDGAESAAAQAATIMKIESLLAASSKTRVEMRNIMGLYNKTALAKLQQDAAGFDWQRYMKNIGAGAVTDVIVMAPKFQKEVGRLMQEIPLADWKVYLRWHVVSGFAQFLSTPFAEENFRFFDKHMHGVQQQPERWKRMTNLTSDTLGDLVGQMYVEKYFPAASKKRMAEMAVNLKKAFATRLAKLQWMSEATRKEALSKLETMRIEVGYPEKWEDFSKLTIDRTSFVGNIERASRFAFEKNLERLQKPVDPGRWDMTPQTVNAGYNPLFNKMIFPAGILQPPFFFPDGDDAVNYGAIGMAIGHEMSHGFDDQGRYFDKDGNMRNWWANEDAEKFKQQTELLVKQYNAFTTADGVHVNGSLSLGENIADYAGLCVSYDAYQLSLQGKPQPPPIDGFNGGQRFFLSFAQVWRGKIRDESLKRKIQEDVHPWGEFRVNGAPFNVPVFYELFDIKPGDKLYRAPQDRPTIW